MTYYLEIHETSNFTPKTILTIQASSYWELLLKINQQLIMKIQNEYEEKLKELQVRLIDDDIPF
jgi:hypothetical protein